MKTNIPVGTLVKVKYMGEWEYGRVELKPDNLQDDDDKYGLLIGKGVATTDAERSQAVHCKWAKDDTLVVCNPPKPKMIPMNRSVWQKTPFDKQMELLMRCGLTYQESAEAYQSDWDRLTPNVQEALQNLPLSS